MQSVTTIESHPRFGEELIRDWIPEGEPRAVIVLVHGIAEHSGRYERTGSLLADAGFLVRSFDIIGHGSSGGNRVDIEDWDQFHHQLHDHMDWAREQGVPVILMGHSMGSLISLGYVLEEGHQPDLMVLSAPALSGGAAWQKALAGPLAKVFPTMSIPQNVKGQSLSRDPEVGEQYFADPLVHTKATARFGAALFEAMDTARSKVEQLSVPTLALHGGADSLVSPMSSVVLGEQEACERRLYPRLRHEILNEPEGPEIVAEIIEWIDQQL